MAKIMATEKFNFTYVYTPTGEIHGSSFIQQTEDAINNVGELAIKAKESADKTGADFADVVKRVDVAEAVSNNALSVANTANSKADTTASVMEAVRLDVQTANGLSTQALEKARTAESNSSIALGKSIEAEKASATAVSQSLEAVNSSAQASASALSSSNEAKIAQQKAIEAKNSASSAEDSARRSAQMAEEARNRIGTTPMPTAERMAKAWPDGVLIYDIELDTLFCGDGQTVGGKKTGGDELPSDVVTTSKLENDETTTIKGVKTQTLTLDDSNGGANSGSSVTLTNTARTGYFYVKRDNAINFSIGKTSANFYNRKLLGVSAPIANTDGANKAYVDATAKRSGVVVVSPVKQAGSSGEAGTLVYHIPTDVTSESVFTMDWPINSLVDGELYRTLRLEFDDLINGYESATVKTLILVNQGEDVPPAITWNGYEVFFNGDPSDLDFSGTKVIILTALRVGDVVFLSSAYNGIAPSGWINEL